MERAILFDEKDIDESNVWLLLTQAETIVNKLPELFDGWYMAGLCYYKLGDKKEALYHLARAYQINPEKKVSALMAHVGGSPAQYPEYKRQHFFTKNKNYLIIYGFVFLILPFEILIYLIKR